VSRGPQLACVVLCASAAPLLIAACGSSSPNAVVHPPVQAARKVPTIPHFVGAGSVHASGSSPVRARPPQPGTTDDEVNSSGAKTLNPCTLVSRSEAQAILHRMVAAPVEALQGPTCIYKPRGAGNFVTLALEPTGFSKVKPQSQLAHRTSLTVGGHAAYCGSAGGPTLILPLAGGQYLAVAAPCHVASAFAAKALSRVR
jgi:hypothetical protein